MQQHEGFQAVKKYISANSQAELPCILERSKFGWFVLFGVRWSAAPWPTRTRFPAARTAASCVVHGLPYASAERAGVDRPHLWAVPVWHLVTLQAAVLDAAANSPKIYGLRPSGVGLCCAGPNRRPASPHHLPTDRAPRQPRSPVRQGIRWIPTLPPGHDGEQRTLRGSAPECTASGDVITAGGMDSHPRQMGNFVGSVLTPVPPWVRMDTLPPVAGRRLRSVASGARGWKRANRTDRLHGSRACPWNQIEGPRSRPREPGRSVAELSLFMNPYQSPSISVSTAPAPRSEGSLRSRKHVRTRFW